MTTKRFAGLLCAGLLATCASEEPTETPPPPLFNAAADSQTCPAGQVGWDFSTGGAAGQDFQAPSTEIHIVQATHGRNCGVEEGNWTAKVASACNGLMTCSRLVYAAGDTDPAVGCAKDLSVRYSCGNEGTVYETFLPQVGPGAAFRLQCGPPLTILKASYGAECNSDRRMTDVTAALADTCNGLRRCQFNSTNDPRRGKDPCVGTHKLLKIDYRYPSGGSTVTATVTLNGGEAIDFSAPAIPATGETSPRIQVRTATFGKNCGAPQDNWLERFKSTCDGQAGCIRKVTTTGDPDPCFGLKHFYLEYTCSDRPFTTESLYLPGDFPGDETVAIQCGASMTITSASYGANVRANLQGNFTQVAQRRCNGHSRCRFQPGPDGGPFKRGNDLFGSDPAPGQNKTWEFEYSCGLSAAPLRKTFQEGDVIDFECGLADQPTTAASGIRIVSATWGKNCSNVASNNVYPELASQCSGRDSCSFPFKPASSFDPAGGCKKDLDVTWRCGEETEIHSVTVSREALGKTVKLQCAPIVNVVSAVLEERCEDGSSQQFANVTTDLEASCTGSRGSCAYVVPTRFVSLIPQRSTCRGMEDSSPNLQYTAIYMCGRDPTPRTAQIDHALNRTVMLECPPGEASPRKACVPAACSGFERRDPYLNCVNNMTLPVLPPIQSAYFSISNLISSQLGGETEASLIEDTSYDLALAVNLVSEVDPRVVGSSGEVEATAYAFDEFRLIGQGRQGLPATVQGFRCILGGLNLRLDQSIGWKGYLQGSIKNSVLPPACFLDDSTASSFADAAKRLGMNEADFRSVYTRVAKSQIRIAFDPEGKTVALRTPGTSASNAISPNPVGFFYKPSRVWLDILSYYQQTTLPHSTRYVATFRRSTRIELNARKAILRNPKVTVSKYGGPAPALDIDFTWTKEGDAPYLNPLSSTDPPLASNVQTLSQLNLGATVAIVPYTKGPSAQPVGANAVDFEVLVRPERASQPHRALPLRGGSATGKTDRLRITIPQSARERILRLVSEGNGWMKNPDETMGLFKVWVCLDTDNTVPRAGRSSEIGRVRRGNTEYSARFLLRCVAAEEPLVVVRDLVQRGLPYALDGAPAGNGGSVDQGSGDFSPEYDSGSERECVGDCTSARNDDANDLNNPGAGGSIFAQTQTVTFGPASAEACGRPAGSIDSCVKAQATAGGFSILDAIHFEVSGDPNDEWKYTVKVNPPYELIINALKTAEEAQEAAGQASPVSASVTFEKEVFHSGDQGLGIGVKLKASLTKSNVPIPLEVELSVGVGVGITLEVNWNDPVAYPCTGDRPCFLAEDEALSQEAAEAACSLKGGRLASARTPEQWAKLGEIATEGGPYWIGGQLGYRYSRASCASAAPPGSCAHDSTTSYEWIHEIDATSRLPLTFARSHGTSNILVAPGASSLPSPIPNFGGGLANLALETRAPLAAGLAFQPGSSPKLLSRPGTEKLPFFCQYDPFLRLSATSSTRIAGRLNGAGGMGAAVCIPSTDVGLCLALGVNFLEVGLEIGTTNVATRLYRERSGVPTLVSERGKWESEVNLSLDLLAGDLSAELRLFIFTMRWIILQFHALHLDFQLWHSETPYRQDF